MDRTCDMRFSHVKAVHPGQRHFLRLKKIASRDEPVKSRDLRPRSITVPGELMTTRRTWPIMDATIASNGSIATPAVVSHRCELFWCGETRRWLVLTLRSLCWVRSRWKPHQWFFVGARSWAALIQHMCT